jgi:uncharacterized protein (DUF1330 family)
MEEEGMSAYIIAQINVMDAAKYQEYSKMAGPATQKHGGRFLVRGGAKTVLEGNIPYQRIVVTEFPDVAAARRFYDSVEYQAAREKRLGAADFNMMVVEGAAP